MRTACRERAEQLPDGLVATDGSLGWIPSSPSLLPRPTDKTTTNYTTYDTLPTSSMVLADLGKRLTSAVSNLTHSNVVDEKVRTLCHCAIHC